MGAAQDLIEKRFGGLVDAGETPVNQTLQTTATLILRPDPDRLQIVIVNLAPNHCFVLPGNNPSSTNGIRLNSNGGSVVLNVEDDGPLTTYEWYGLHDTLAGAIYVLTLRGLPREA